MTATDVGDVVRVHRQSFPGFFLTALGNRFLATMYRESVRAGAIAFVALSDGEVIGFVIGSEKPQGFYRRLLARNLVGFAIAALPHLARHPVELGRVRRAFSIARSVHAPGDAVLMSLGVEPRGRGRGVGQALVTAFNEEAAERGVTKVTLLTPRDSNDATNRFWQHSGFRLLREVHGENGPMMNEYERDLQPR